LDLGKQEESKVTMSLMQTDIMRNSIPVEIGNLEI